MGHENCFLVTSANPANDAVNDNIEPGLLPHNKYDALKLISQFEKLIGNHILERYG